MRFLKFARADVRRWPSRASFPLAVAGLLAASGCSPTPPSSAELGSLVYDVEQMPGAHKRFLLPEIKGKGGGKAAKGGAEHPPHEGHTHAEDAPGGK